MSTDQSVAEKLLGRAPDPIWVRAPAGYRIPVRRYGVDGTRRPVVMLHGLQSHSGWFVQSARRLADAGMPVHAFDRCGSGLSPQDCDVNAGFAGLRTEIDAVIEHALAESGHDSIVLLGHCFGVIPALLYAGLERPDRVAGLVLTTPAFFTHTDVGLKDKARVFWSVLTRRPTRVPVPLAPEDFSEQGAYVDFVRNDPLVLKDFPARLLFGIRQARRKLEHAARGVRAPTFVAMAGDDRICDNERGRQLLENIRAPLEVHEYPRARHILEFSDARDEFFGDLITWIDAEIVK